MLTDEDFGRAYLTEGWARRFLIEVFRSFDVLFIGYSHQDIVLTYLARALPAAGPAVRFALSHESSDEANRWDLLGIRFVPYDNDPEHRSLRLSVEKLAEHIGRGALDWQLLLTEIGRAGPPVDDESIARVEHALGAEHTTRFLTENARCPTWPKWLDDRKHLARLFEPGSLAGKDLVLAEWLAEHYATIHPSALFELIMRHGMSINPHFWSTTILHLGRRDKQDVVTSGVLTRWAPIVIATAPRWLDALMLGSLESLVRRCMESGAHRTGFELFALLARPVVLFRPTFNSWPGEGVGDGPVRVEISLPREQIAVLANVWTASIRPNVSFFDVPLVSMATSGLEAAHHNLVVWSQADREHDRLSWSSRPLTSLNRSRPDLVPMHSRTSMKGSICRTGPSRLSSARNSLSRPHERR